jgi:hypothetical protein
MRNLSSTLLAAQRSATRRPYVKVQVLERVGGVTRLPWVEVYAGSETDYYHAATCPGDGSLVRFVVDPADNKLYRQKV